MIRLVRASVMAELQAANVDWPVYDYRPDDMTGLPAVVVDRPSVSVNVQHHIASVPVVVIGRRDGTADAQYELDEVASRVVDLLAGPQFNVDRIEPATASIAELTYPAYTVTVSCGVTYCKENPQ